MVWRLQQRRRRAIADRPAAAATGRRGSRQFQGRHRGLAPGRRKRDAQGRRQSGLRLDGARQWRRLQQRRVQGPVRGVNEGSSRMPQEVTIKKWRAFDGKLCDTRKEAEAHESENYLLVISGEVVGGLAAAVALEPQYEHVTAALERAGLEIKRARRAKAE